MSLCYVTDSVAY